MFLLEDIKISFRNPIKFINQWEYFTFWYKFRAGLIWLLWAWRRNDCDMWYKNGVRILGIEIQYTQYIIHKKGE